MESGLAKRIWAWGVISFVVIGQLAVAVFHFEYWPITDYRFYSQPHHYRNVELYAFVGFRADQTFQELNDSFWKKRIEFVSILLRNQKKVRAFHLIRGGLKRCPPEFERCALMRKIPVEREGGLEFVFQTL